MVCALAAVLLAVGSVVAASKTAWQVADELVVRGQYQDAYDLYAKLEREYIQYPRERQWALYQQGICKLKDRQATEAFLIWQRLRTFYPQSPLVVKTLLLEADSPEAAARRDRLYDEVLAKYPTSAESATVMLTRAQAAYEQKDYKTAVTWWKGFVGRFPERAEIAEVKKKLEVAELAATGNRVAMAQLEGAELLRRADGLFDRAEFKEAGRLYSAALQKPGADVAHVASRLARCQLALGEEKEAFNLLQQTAQRLPADAPRLLSELVVHSAGSRNMDELRMQVTEWLVSHYPRTFEAQQALFVAGAVAQGRHHRAEAETHWKRLLDKYPKTEFRQAVEEEFKLAKREEEKKAKPPTREEWEAQRLTQRQQCEREAQKLESVWRNAQATPGQRARNGYELAGRYTALGKYAYALAIYHWIWEQVPDSPWADEAAFAAAQTWLKMDEPEKAEGQLLFVLSRFPQSDLCPLTLCCLGNRQVMYKADLKAAWLYYQQLLTKYPQHPLAEHVRTYWATLKKLPPGELRKQVADYLQKRRRQHRT